jgi:hypothetical protein
VASRASEGRAVIAAASAATAAAAVPPPLPSAGLLIAHDRAPAEVATLGAGAAAAPAAGGAAPTGGSIGAGASAGASGGSGGGVPTVFLGGACNPTTWRRDVAMPALERAGVSYFNPQVDEWHPDLIEIEANAKAGARLLLFVIGPETRGVASMVEAAELIACCRNVVLVLQDIPPGTTFAGRVRFAGRLVVSFARAHTIARAHSSRRRASVAQELPPDEVKDLNRGRAYLADVADRHGVPVYQSIEAATEEIVRRAAGDAGAAQS